MKHDNRSFFDRHPLISVGLGLLAALLLCYLATPDPDAAAAPVSAARGAV